MKKITASILASMFLAMPFIASADSLNDLMDQTRFSLFRAAAIQANFDPSKPACVVQVSTTSVRVHQQFILAWGAWGTLDSDTAKNIWAPTGAFVMALDTPGTYKYQFKFYGAGGVETLCQASVSVK